MVALSNSSIDARSAASWKHGRIGELPALRAADGREAGRHLEARRLVVAPPAFEARQLRGGMPLVHEDAAKASRSSVEVLVGAPGGEVGAVVVQAQLEVARAVREVEADEGVLRVRGA